MAIGAMDEELARATERMPFSNGFEGEAWMGAWCYRCIRYDDCNLITVSLLGRTPAAWTEVHPRGLTDRYRCSEFRGRPYTGYDQ